MNCWCLSSCCVFGEVERCEAAFVEEVSKLNDNFAPAAK